MYMRLANLVFRGADQINKLPSVFDCVRSVCRAQTSLSLMYLDVDHRVTKTPTSIFMRFSGGTGSPQSNEPKQNVFEYPYRILCSSKQGSLNTTKTTQHSAF